MTIEAATTVVQAAQKARLPSSISMLIVILGAFLISLGLTGGQSLKAQPTVGTAVGSASGGGSSGAS